jgi:gas vesicle protein
VKQYSMKTKQFLFGFLIGGVAAGFGTLLSAPAPGKKTRESLKQSKDLWLRQLSELKDSIVELKDVSISVSKEGKTQVSHFIAEVNDSIATWKADTHPHQVELKKEISAVETAIQQLEDTLSAR